MADCYKHRRQIGLWSDNEFLSMVLISECQGWDVVTEHAVTGNRIVFYFLSFPANVATSGVNEC